MNQWSLSGGVLEHKDWAGGGGSATCSKSIRHRSIHPLGRDDEYRAANRRNRFKSRAHGRLDGSEPAPKGKKK